MGEKLGRILSSWIFWAFSCALALGSLVTYVVVRTPLSEVALKKALAQEMLKDFDVKGFSITKKSFDLKHLEWDFELDAQIEKVWNIPIKIKNFKIEGNKKLFGQMEIKKATLRFADDETVFKGGASIQQIESGYQWDLSNLEVSLGNFQKKLGEACFLNVKDKNDELIKAQLIYEGLELPFHISHANNSFVLQIPQTQVTTKKQKLPFSVLDEIPSSGLWTISLRAEFKDNVFTEASSVKVDKALVSVAEMGSSLMRNGRGIGLLSVDMSSAENLLNGNFDLDLEKATFELNEGLYFKPDGVPFHVSGNFLQSKGNLKVEAGDSKVAADFSRDGTYMAKVEDFDLTLIPHFSQRNYLTHGTIDGQLKGSLETKLLGEWHLGIDSLNADKASFKFENFSAPGLHSSGAAFFDGKFTYDSTADKMHYDGELDLRKARLSLEDIYQKDVDEPLKLKIKMESTSNKDKSFQASTSINEDPIEIKANNSQLVLNFPRGYKSSRGLASGSVTYKLCNQNICPNDNIQAYNLSLADFKSSSKSFEDILFSGKIQKSGENIEMKDFSLKWPSGDRLLVSGNWEKNKKADLKVDGNFEYKNFATSNPFLFFREFPLQEATLKLSLNLKNEEQSWAINSNADYHGRKLIFDKLSISQNSKNNYKGTAEIDLEAYLFRNEAAVLTSTLNSSGNLNVFDGLLMRGSYDATEVVGSSGLNLSELLSRMNVRASGTAVIDQLPVTLLIGQGLDAYAKEKQRSSARNLAKCYPKYLKGKFDIDYNQAGWNLAPSIFQGMDKDSMIKLQGSLGDLSNINMVVSYLPGPKCDRELADCLGNAFPKGGMALEITGPFKDPETDFDFALIDQSLEKCHENEAHRGVAAENQVDTRDQKARIKELKDFYKSRKYSP